MKTITGVENMVPDGDAKAVQEPVAEAVLEPVADLIPDPVFGATGAKEHVIEATAAEGTTAEETTAEERIVDQLEFYFGDANLPFDDKMKTLTGPNGDGWVDVGELLRFNKLAAIASDAGAIMRAIRNAAPCCLLEVNETTRKIRRKPEYPMPVLDQQFYDSVIERSVYCKGFPTDATVDEIVDFAGTFGRKVVVRVTPRRFKKPSQFKGSVYLTFSTKEQAEGFLNLESVKYAGVELERMWQRDFKENKKKQFEECMVSKRHKTKSNYTTVFKKGFLLKADNFDDTVTVDDVNTVCQEYKWKIDYIKFIADEKTAWIRLTLAVAAKDRLEQIKGRENKFNICFSLPTENEEQSVLCTMAKERTIAVNNRRCKNKRNKRT